MVEEKRRLDIDDPVVIDIVQRVTRLEERVLMLEKIINMLREKISKIETLAEKIDSRTWYIITGIILSILIQILMRLLH